MLNTTGLRNVSLVFGKFKDEVMVKIVLHMYYLATELLRQHGRVLAWTLGGCWFSPSLSRVDFYEANVTSKL